uniref:Dehydrogenase/reductase SDR family member 4-like n=1 Tax=Phallusia mammillata TaxID=59560 RepID=A0A6F9DBR7_9ASCI|nr:dehydrogenase/reductase SDR family member 4-like [Phallusia mammillata]
MRRFDNLVALVTASTEGIGFAIARKLAQDGAHVVVSSRKQANVERAVKSLKDENLSVTGMVCHVAKKENRMALLDMIVEKLGRLDILVLNAAANPHTGKILLTPESVYDKIFDVNVKSTFMFIQESVPLMRKQEKGSVVIVSSMGGYDLHYAQSVYGFSKTALLGMTKALVNDLADSNIRINCIAPGIIRTTFSKYLFKNGEKALVKNARARRVGEPDECAGIVAFLCSGEASYINGETVVVAGETPSRL